MGCQCAIKKSGLYYVKYNFDGLDIADSRVIVCTHTAQNLLPKCDISSRHIDIHSPIKNMQYFYCVYKLLKKRISVTI